MCEQIPEGNIISGHGQNHFGCELWLRNGAFLTLSIQNSFSQQISSFNHKGQYGCVFILCVSYINQCVTALNGSLGLVTYFHDAKSVQSLTSLARMAKDAPSVMNVYLNLYDIDSSRSSWTSIFQPCIILEARCFRM